MQHIENSEELTGYRVKVVHKPAFKITGFTLIVPPGADTMIPQFWDDALADGRVEKLSACAENPPLLGLGSWDRECEKGGSRYTIGIEAVEGSDFTRLAQEYPLFTKEIDETDWLCFETTWPNYEQQFWKDDPYAMLKQLGYRFNSRGFNLGMHYEVYPPGFDPETRPQIEFWITVKKPS